MDHHNAQHSVSEAGVIIDDQRGDNGRWEAPGPRGHVVTACGDIA
ncbi:hypothetical protein [Nonomuraea aurantiaca]|jgi:hypothetical protein|nr:hypothetical protein [Nonomuraea aurantiaca]